MKNSKVKYDYIIVGAGLYGSVAANLLTNQGKKCLVIDKRCHIGGNIYTEQIKGINVHKYGAHIFHTNNKQVWDYVRQFAEFNRYTNAPIANYKGNLYNLPFNMNTFYQIWGVKTPAEALNKLEQEQTKVRKTFLERGLSEAQNLEEQALLLVGYDIYEKLIKGYTEKQWGRKCCELPAFIIKRLPVRFTFDNNYFNDKYQGIPIGGYTAMIERMLDGCEVKTGIDYIKHKEEIDSLAENIIYTGEIDRYFDYKFGHLQYRTVYFKTEIMEGVNNYQGNAVVNYTDNEIPYTRIIEHKHFEFGQQPDTVISHEYSKEWQPGDEPYYPINDERNSSLYQKYKTMTHQLPNVFFGGRLAEYKYYDMDKIVERALIQFAN